MFLQDFEEPSFFRPASLGNVRADAALFPHFPRHAPLHDHQYIGPAPPPRPLHHTGVTPSQAPGPGPASSQALGPGPGLLSSFPILKPPATPRPYNQVKLSPAPNQAPGPGPDPRITLESEPPALSVLNPRPLHGHEPSSSPGPHPHHNRGDSPSPGPHPHHSRGEVTAS